MVPQAQTPSSGDSSPYAAHTGSRSERTSRSASLILGRGTCFCARVVDAGVHRRRRCRFCGWKRNINIVFTVGTLIFCALLLNLAILLNRYSDHRTAQQASAAGHHGHDSVSAGRISSKHYAGAHAIGAASWRQRPDTRTTATSAESVSAETVPTTVAPAVKVEVAATVTDAPAPSTVVVVESVTQPPAAIAAINQISAAAAAVATTMGATSPATPTTPAPTTAAAATAAAAAAAFPTGPVVDGISVLSDGGTLWDRNLCPRRKDNKPYKIHVWFSHVHEGKRVGLRALLKGTRDVQT